MKWPALAAAIWITASCGGSAQAPSAYVITPSPSDAVLAQYRSAVDQGWGVIFAHGNTWSNHCQTGPGGAEPTMAHPAQCRADSLQLKADVQASLDQLVAPPAKPALQDADRQYRQDLRDTIPQLDRLAAAIDSADVQAEGDARVQVFKLFSDAWYWDEVVDCWPKSVQRNGSEAASRFSCI